MRADRERLLSIIETDGEELNAESSRAANKEFSRIAAEFFETEGDGKLTVERQKRGIFVTFTVRAKRVKNFIPLR